MSDLVSREAVLSAMAECYIPGTEDKEFGPDYHATLVKAMWKVRKLPSASQEMPLADELAEAQKRDKWYP